MKFLILGILSLVAAVACASFGYSLYTTNIAAVQEQNDYHRKQFAARGLSYVEAEADMTNPTKLMFGLAVVGGAAGIFCLLKAREARKTSAAKPAA